MPRKVMDDRASNSVEFEDSISVEVSKFGFAMLIFTHLSLIRYYVRLSAPSRHAEPLWRSVNSEKRICRYFAVRADAQDHAVAGFTAGTVATLIMHPLDLIKVRFQLANNSVASSSMTSKRPGFGRAVYGALEDAVRADGWKGLYRGLSPNLVGSASSWGLYFLL